MTAYGKIALFIEGEWRTANKTIAVTNPADGKVIGNVPVATIDDLDQALAAAQRGFDLWSTIGVDRRTAILSEAARLMRERADAIGAMMSLEQGKPIAEARAEVIRSVNLIEWDIQEGKRTYGRIVPSAAGFRNMVLKLPIGPVAAFTPWNFPASIPARKLGALAAGCSLILKAAEETPATACAMVQCYADAGLPPGVLNLVFGDPAQISEHLISSPVIRAVTLTGSVPVGKRLAALSASHMKPVVMELGGHAPVIVCEDADAKAVAKLAIMAKFRNAGQICTCPTRFIVHSSLQAEFLEIFAEGARALKIGAGDMPGVQMGPLANERRVEAIDALVQDAVVRGARVVTGGKKIARPGHFYEPTIISDIPDGARVLRDEPFGPIALVQTFNVLDEAIRIANALPFGLASYAFTRSASVANTLAERVESGLMSINHLGASQPEGPFGGVKDSGYGREGGVEGLDAFLVSKYVSHQFEAG